MHSTREHRLVFQDAPQESGDAKRKAAGTHDELSDLKKRMADACPDDNARERLDVEDEQQEFTKLLRAWLRRQLGNADIPNGYSFDDIEASIRVPAGFRMGNLAITIRHSGPSGREEPITVQPLPNIGQDFPMTNSPDYTIMRDTSTGNGILVFTDAGFKKYSPCGAKKYG